MPDETVRVERRDDGSVVLYVHGVARCRYESLETAVQHLGMWLDRTEQLSRTVEACRRYFEHTQRVSVSSNSCKSGQMAVRMALKAEAAEAVRKIDLETSDG